MVNNKYPDLKIHLKVGILSQNEIYQIVGCVEHYTPSSVLSFYYLELSEFREVRHVRQPLYTRFSALGGSFLSSESS